MITTEQPCVAKPSRANTEAAIRILFRADQVVELRALGSSGATTAKRFTLSGYYNDREMMAADVIGNVVPRLAFLVCIGPFRK